MKKFITLFMMFSFLFATRYDISFEKMQEFNSSDKKIILKKVIVSNAKHNYSSKHFTIYWGDENPATTLWADYNKDGIPDFITNSAKILEYVWDTEINKFGFNTPEFNHINVYISDTNIYLDGKKLTLSDDICGYAVYTGDEEYIVINATPPSSYVTSAMNMLKITLAHEFFHLVQYGYSLDFSYTNLWLYEGTAVLMEHLVYPDIADYLYSYVESFFNYPEIGLINYNGLSTYSSVIFFDYLEKKYGLEFIKNIWETFNTDKSALYTLNSVLKEYNSTLNNELYNFYNDLEYNLSAFSNSNILKTFDLEKKDIYNYANNTYLYPTGAIFVNSPSKNVSFINNDFDNNLTTLSKNYNNVFAYNTNDFIISFPKKLDFNNLYYDTISYVSKNETLNINKGWNLITFKNDENLSNYNFDIVWMYRNNKWYAFSKKKKVKQYLLDNNMYCETVFAKEGAWIYSNEVNDINISVKKGEISYNLNNGWNLISFPSYLDLNLSFFSKIYNINQIWIYENSKWNFFSNDINLSTLAKKLNYNIISKINSNGFWIYKK